MKRFLLSILCLIFFNQIYSDEYKTAQRFDDGDVISADVLNDILDRIELSLKGISESELIGTWDATQYYCGYSLPDPSVDATTPYSTDLPAGGPWGCNGTRDKALNNGTNMDGLALKRTDTVQISAVTGSETLVDVAFATNSMFYSDSNGNTYESLNQSKTHRCSFVGDGALLGCKLDESIVDSFNPERKFASYFNVQRLSNSRIKLFWGPWRGDGLFNIIILDKKDEPPLAPLFLSVSLNSGIASFLWTAGDSSETGYDIQRKNSNDGNYASIGTSTTESYEDSTIVKGNTYWYRVFATNTNGSSIGSNVIKITYLNTPPSMNLASTISVNEGETEVIDVGATDSDGDSLTYTIGSQDPSNDATNFSISSAGVISFNSAPDWENPSDYNTDNIYTINVSVSDGTETVIQDIGIVVQNIDD